MAQNNAQAGNKAKTGENQAKSILKISQSKDWTSAGLKVTIDVMIVADRVENVEGREITFFNASNHNTLKRSTTTSRGKASYSYTVPIAEAKQGAKKKIGIKVKAKIGASGKAIEKFIFDEVEIEHGLPIGGFKSLVAFRIRLNLHLKHFFFASFLIGVFVSYVHYADTRNFSLGTVLVAATIVGLWWKQTKSVFRTVLCALMVSGVLLSLSFRPDTFSTPLIRGAILSLFLGAPFYIIEELHRKPDGTSVRNYYPLWPIIVCFLAMVGLTFNSLGDFIPKQSEVSIFVSNSNFQSAGSWSFLNYIPFLGHVDFQHIASNIEWIVSFFIAGCILLIYGGSRELIEWYNTAKGGLTPDMDATGFAGILAIIQQLWVFFRDAISPLIGLGKGGKR